MSVKGWVQKCEEQEEREGWVKKDAGQTGMVAQALDLVGHRCLIGLPPRAAKPD
jgi:hypothetical protein